MSEKDIERKIELLQMENEELDQRVSVEEKKARIREAKAMYGKDWKKMIGGAISKIRIDKESMQSLHSMGMGDPELRDLSNPRMLRRV